MFISQRSNAVESRNEKQEETDNDGIALFIHGTTAIPNPSYDTLFTNFVSNISKRIAWLAESGLFTPSNEIKFIRFIDLIALEDKYKPKSALYFSKYFSTVAPDPDNQLYIQWSGDLGRTAWRKTTDALTKKIEELIEKIRQTRIKSEKKPDDPIHIHIIAHSHGGQIARFLANAFKDKENIRFHIATVSTPQSLLDPLLMPKNVDTLQDFSVSGDFMKMLGTYFMQIEYLMGDLPLYSLEGLTVLLYVLSNSNWNKYADTLEKLYQKKGLMIPPGYASYRIPMKIPYIGKSGEEIAILSKRHEGPMNEPAAVDIIVKIMLIEVEASKKRLRDLLEFKRELK